MTPARPAFETDGLTGLTDLQGPCTVPLDAAMHYLRVRVERVLPLYVLAMAPHAAAMILLIDEVVAGRRSKVAVLSLALALATLWRWVWLARLQVGVLVDLREGTADRFWARVPAMVWTRLATNVALTWGSILVLPGFYGLFLGGFAAPLLVESTSPALKRLSEGMNWVHHASRRLLRVTLVMSVISLVALVGAFASQAVLAHTVLPSLLGVDTADLSITLDSWAWRMRVCYVVFLLVDAFWTVACVFLYFDSQSRRTAPDLRARLFDLTRAAE